MQFSRLQLDAIQVCYPIAILPKQDDAEKKNIFVGIGLWSKTHGLTAGLPIDVLTMLITADKIQKQLDSSATTIYIYVADNLALESRADQPGITEKNILQQRDSTIQLLTELCQLLQITNVIIEDSSTVTNSLIYQEILQEVEIAQSTLVIPGVRLEESSQNYVLKQTALINFYQREKNCAVKISWCYNNQEIGNCPWQIIREGVASQNYDELWFDAYYQLLVKKNYPIGFVYTQSGRSLNQSTNNTAAPYFAKNPLDYPRILFGDTIETLQEKIPFKKTTGPSKKKGIFAIESSPQIRYQLPPKFKKLMLAILQDLKESYGELIPIKSKKGESNPDTIVRDLARIADFRKYLVNGQEKYAVESYELNLLGFDAIKKSEEINANCNTNFII